MNVQAPLESPESGCDDVDDYQACTSSQDVEVDWIVYVVLIVHTISIREFKRNFKPYSCSMTTVPEIRTSFPSLVKKNHPSVCTSELI
jgi:hypothetical protein